MAAFPPDRPTCAASTVIPMVDESADTKNDTIRLMYVYYYMCNIQAFRICLVFVYGLGFFSFCLGKWLWNLWCLLFGSAVSSTLVIPVRGNPSCPQVLSGGSTMFRGFGDRLLNELRKLAPKEMKIRISVRSSRTRQLALRTAGSCPTTRGDSRFQVVKWPRVIQTAPRHSDPCQL